MQEPLGGEASLEEVGGIGGRGWPAEALADYDRTGSIAGRAFPDEPSFREIVETVPAAIYTTDADGLITFYNEAAANLWGCHPELGKSEFCGSWKLFHPDGTPMPHDECPMALTLKQKRPIHGKEAIAERPDGTRVPFMPYPTPLFDASGVLVGAVNLLVDITDRKRVEDEQERARRQAEAHAESQTRERERARESEERFRNLADGTPVLIWVNGLEGCEFVNRAYREYVEVGDESEVQGYDWTRYIHPDDRDGYLRAYAAAEERRAPFSASCRFRRRDGEYRWMLSSGIPRFGGSNEFLGYAGSSSEVHELKQAAHAASRLAAIVDSSDDAILSKDLNGIIATWNRGAERLFGYTAEEMVGKPVVLLIPEDRQDEEPGILSRIRRGERIDHYETIRRRKDGSLVEISLSVSPIRDASGAVIGASKIARDISERRRAEETKELLLGEMKHRVKNSLAAVQALASQTLKSASEQERSQFVNRLHALSGAHDLLADQNWNRALIAHVVRRAIEPFQAKHQERILLEGPEDIALDANKSLLLTMALHELGTNAVKYGSLANGTGRVHIVWAAPSEGRLVLSWRENGGPAVTTPLRKGFGSTLIERALNGSVGAAHFDFAPVGLSCTLEIVL